jgi:hypothetical protein
LPGFFINCHFILSIAVLVAIAVCEGAIHLSNIIHSTSSFMILHSQHFSTLMIMT